MSPTAVCELYTPRVSSPLNPNRNAKQHKLDNTQPGQEGRLGARTALRKAAEQALIQRLLRAKAHRRLRRASQPVPTSTKLVRWEEGGGTSVTPKKTPFAAGKEIAEKPTRSVSASKRVQDGLKIPPHRGWNADLPFLPDLEALPTSETVEVHERPVLRLSIRVLFLILCFLAGALLHIGWVMMWPRK